MAQTELHCLQGLKEDVLATIMKPVIEAIAYLHGNAPPILHRDIKVGLTGTELIAPMFAASM